MHYLIESTVHMQPVKTAGNGSGVELRLLSHICVSLSLKDEGLDLYKLGFWTGCMGKGE